MFTLTRLSTTPTRLEPLRLPITVLLAIPGDLAPEDSSRAFNVPGTINDLMGSAGWERAIKVMTPKIWAPGWSDRDLSRFASARSAKKRRVPPDAIRDLRLKVFPPRPARPIDLSAAWPRYEVIHVVSTFASEAAVREPVLRLATKGRGAKPDDFTAGRLLAAGTLRDLLVALGCRLLILHATGRGQDNASRLGRHVVGAGGPATIVVSGGTRRGVDRYFANLYANIVHNKPLSEVAKPSEDPDPGAPNVDAILEESGDDALQFDRWLKELGSKIRETQRSYRELVNNAVGDRLMLLHTNQRQHLETTVWNRVVPRKTRAIIGDLPRLEAILNRIDWAHERKGALPLSELSEAVSKVEATARAFALTDLNSPAMVTELRTSARKMAAAAPRVLNANFRHPRRRRMVGANEGLVPGQKYDLLVDVGPRWTKAASIVRGQAGFPDRSLPPGKKGYRVRVVLFSDDFVPAEAHGETSLSAVSTPISLTGAFDHVEVPPLSDAPAKGRDIGYQRPVATAEMWVPQGSGGSFPIVKGKRSRTARPVRLRVTVRQARRGDSLVWHVRGRLSLYYENNLLQSALVQFGVTQHDLRVDPAHNAITVDYVLSGSFTELHRYSTRVLGRRRRGSVYPVGVSIATNDDGAGGHRLMIADRSDLTISRPYDPAASAQTLQTARNKLKECFWERDADCIVSGETSALHSDNGKDFAQFKCDLYQLAWYGSDLYAEAFGQMSSPGILGYLQRLREALAFRTVIQVARTSLAQYVYPWAMLYDIPLPNRNVGALKWCKVLDEWAGSNGRQSLLPAKQCPYHKDPDHRQDVLCPYGFWGLKHYIEQPINVQPQNVAVTGAVPAMPVDAESKVKLGKPITLGVGVTRDATLDMPALEAHLTRIRTLAAYTPAKGASDWTEVQTMLDRPDIVYFLCHGEFDQAQRKPYLGVGPKDNDQRHRVYPDQLFNWALTKEDFWKNRHPLIFINGCHTADLKPGEILSFVTTFANFGASAVIGTEVSIRLPLAAEIAENLLKRIVTGQAVGAAMHEVRWDLVNKRNLIGLAYTPYCLSDLTFVPT